MRQIDKIINSRDVQMGPNTIAQPLPSSGISQADPFLLIHHAGPKNYNPGDNALSVDAHPHRGFDPVTFVFNGEVEHKDSLGNHSIIGAGGVQWITAGKGIVHSEKTPASFREKGGMFEIIQLWINVPKSQKYSEPTYQGFASHEIPQFQSDDKKTRLSIFAGKYKDLSGPVRTRNDIQAYTAYLEKDGQIDLEFEPELNVIIYQLGGHTTTNSTEISDKQLVIFKREESGISIKAAVISRLLILAGAPLREPIFQYGPFVLNSKEELIDTIRDFETGKMGHM
jgi:redox-sensitive bicupin YhaK (pirin superfamily)